MEGVSRILIAIDFSKYSLITLRAGLGLAQDTGAVAVLLSVINGRDVAAIRAARAYTDAVTEEEYIRVQTGDRLEKLDALVNEAACGPVDIEKIVRVGHPAAENLRAIKETGVDVVVVGTKGRTDLSHMVFGSVAEKVHRRSPVSVLSVRGDSHAELVCRLEA